MRGRAHTQPENILCKDSLFDIKIGDFGLSKLVFPDEKLDYPCGTLNYIGVSASLLSHTAPEVISKQGYTTKADMWSLGVIFYLLWAFSRLLTCSLRGRLPFDGDRQDAIIKAIVTAQPDYNNSAFLNLSYNVAPERTLSRSVARPSRDFSRRTPTCVCPRRT